MKRFHYLLILLFICALFCIGKIFLSDKDTKKDTDISSQIDIAERFISALQTENKYAAIAYASNLIDTQSIPMPSAQKYALIFKDSGIAPSYLTDRFNHLDYVFWRRRIIFHELAHKIIKNGMTNEQKILSLFEAVTKHIGKAENIQNLKGFWPEQIWHNKNGLCDRQSWVLFELLRSVELKPVMVLLYNSKNISHHTILTVSADKKSYILDPFCKVKKIGMTVEQLLDPAMKNDPFVVEYTKIMPDTKDAKYSLFLSPQEYVMRNIILADVLRKKGINFHLTADMQKTVGDILKEGNIPAEKFTLSTYPFFLLVDDLKNNRTPNQSALKLSGN